MAETSLTIEGVRTVVDSGLVRRSGWDPYRGMDTLHLVKISKASAAQRAGRAGRVAPGRCFRLWSEAEQARKEDFDPPECFRVDLAGAVLNLAAWGVTVPEKFPLAGCSCPPGDAAGREFVGCPGCDGRGWKPDGYGKKDDRFSPAAPAGPSDGGRPG
ncbi:hypothetical protein M5E88_15345 [Akkermansia muciniphila]|nr:hypothetical protein M5E88_15345 [Akkermansia muciniphila]